MKKSEALGRGLNIIENERFLFFSTMGEDGFPRTRIMFNLRSPGHYPYVDRSLFAGANGFTLYIGTNTSSNKIPQLRRDPRVSAYFTDLGTWEGILLSGSAEFVDSLDAKRAVWTDSWTVYYPGGVEDPDMTLLRLDPVGAEVYGGGEVHHFSGEELLAR